jgi:hypothetical protein
MLQKRMQVRKLQKGVTQGIISLFHQGGKRLKLPDWSSIMLLNISYKIFAKVMQLQLQPLLMEIISLDQSIFFLMR